MGKRRFVYFDMLSIVATLAVVFLHCNGIVHWGAANAALVSSPSCRGSFLLGGPRFLYVLRCKDDGVSR